MMFSFAIAGLLLVSAGSEPVSVAIEDTLKASVVSVSKVNALLDKASASVITVSSRDAREKKIEAPKALSSLVPNLHIPDYGSAMTSSIYVRGIGSRMENPSIGLYVDEVPVLDKNMFDTDFLDIQNINFISGPQGTLFGRNAMMGVLSVETLKPSAQNKNFVSLGFGSGGAKEASALLGNDVLMLAAKAFDLNGFYTNTYNDSKIDGGRGLSFRIKYRPYRREGRSSDYSLWVSYLNQGGWPYRQMGDDGAMAPLSFNDRNHYSRLSLLASAREGFGIGNHRLKNIVSLQMMGDKMSLDQDFTPASMFTLQQRQRQAALTEELIFKPSSGVSWWDSQTGVFISAKYNRMHAPVNFLPDGIETLILGNANSHIPPFVGRLAFEEESFIIGSDFDLFYQNTALYHESWFTFGLWKFTAGIRADFEYQHMAYDSRATVHYALPPRMPSFKELETVFEGSIDNSWLQIVPKVAVRYGTEKDYLYASAAGGFRAGGFNTQIFSDMLQNLMTANLMDAFGVHIDGYSTTADASSTEYKPEESWNFEAGGRTSFSAGASSFILAASAFDIECRNQQITIFPRGNATGRLMANAGRSRSFGADGSLSWLWNGFRADVRAGWCHATFREYNDNINDYAGRHIPYAPVATWYGALGRHFSFAGKTLKGLSLSVSACGTGRIWWNEDNSLWQKAYCLFGADASVDFDRFQVFAHASNLFEKDYGVFCFKSVGNTFIQRGRPRCIFVGVRINI